MFRLLKIKFLLFLAVTGVTQTQAQQKIISGIVKDQHSEEPIPFASVYFVNTRIGKLTDTAGHFQFILNGWPSDTLEISTVGYQTFQFVIDRKKDSFQLNVMMERGTFNQGVIVRAKVNPGLFLWRKIVQHKNQNDRYRFENFSYELYNKLEVDMKNINFQKFSRFKPLKPISELIKGSVDTSEGLPYLPAYLTEVLSDYYYQKKPLKRREVIKAVNTNGVKNESIIGFLGGMDQNVNMYNNFIPVFNKQFVSPVSDNGDNYYIYRVIDTQMINQQRFYHLSFVPKRRGENTFEGDSWIHAGTFAIQKMNLRLGKDANVNFVDNLSMIQEYQLLDDSTTWFLAKDKFVVDVTPVGSKSIGLIGRKTTTYRNIVVNDSSVVRELNKNKLFEEVHTLDGAADKNRSFWTDNRHEQLSKNESAIIKMMDTLTNAPAFKKFTNTLYFITVGYVNKGIFEFGPWFNVMTANSWEGFRTRFDLGTNTRFSKKLWLHSYLAYGFGDKQFKWKAEAFYLMNRHPRTALRASVSDDLEFGQNYFGEVTADNIFALAIRKNNIPIKFMRVNEKLLGFYHQTKSGFSADLSATHKTFTPLQNIPLKDSIRFTGSGRPFTTFETTLKLRFAYLERFLESNFNRLSIGSPYPIPELTVTKGMAGVWKSSYSYTKVSGSISDFIKIPPLGSIDFYLYAGKTFGTLPYVLLDIAPGNELYYYNKYAFNLMNKYEFVHDRYTGFNFEHNIGNGLFRFIPKLKFRQFWNIKMLWGRLSAENKALNFINGHNFQSLDGKTYMELGTGIDNILKVLRLDLVWRVSPSPIPKQTSKRFGIFGSFRFSF
ncbi:MAG: carboxypeptidase-like regulatory domain-containing protein [Terrimonas sp.]|nr:carboxypeptidase-like regulatory domain-containing protein [Terrimonas sp.]